MPSSKCSRAGIESVMSDEIAALRCPACGGQIVSRRLGFCPSCRENLPEMMKLQGADRDRIEREHLDAVEKLREARRGGGDSSGGIL